jgi:hypothetical protein
VTTPLIRLVGRELARALPSAGATEAATATARTPGSVADGTNPTSASYSCKAFVSTERHDAIGDTLVETTDRVVCILGQTLSVTPRKGDRLTIDSVTQRIESFEGTPALWLVLLRG